MNKKQLNQFVDMSKIKENNKRAYIERMSIVPPEEFVDTYLQYCRNYSDADEAHRVDSRLEYYDTLKQLTLIKILVEKRKLDADIIIDELKSRLTVPQWTDFFNLVMEYSYQKGFDDGLYSNYNLNLIKE